MRLLLLLILLITSCGKVHHRQEDSRIKVLSTIAQIGDLVQIVGGDRIQAQVLVRGELNPHTYELVKGDDEKIEGARCIFYNGLGLEHSASVSAKIAAHPHALAVGDAIQKLYPERILWKDSTIDPHIWMDVSLWSEAVDPIAAQLIAIDPEGKDYYLERAFLLKRMMAAVDEKMLTLLQAIPEERRYLVTSHDAFQYFARRYLAANGNWEDRFAAPEGLSPDGQLHAGDLQKIVDHLRAHRITVLFPESNVSRDSIRKIASAVDVRICKEALYGDSIHGHYLEAMMKNAKTIAENL